MSELTNEEQVTIEELRAGPAPPAKLEARTVAALKAGGLLAAPSWRPWLVAVAAFLLGVGVGARRSTPSTPGYVLLLSGGSRPSGSEEVERVREYAGWASALRRDGVPISGERFADGARVFRDGSSEASSVSGYFLFDADSAERAAEIAQTCPHLSYGGDVTLGRVAR